MPQSIKNQIPHLTTALTGPLLHLEKIFLAQQAKIEGWFRQQWQQTPPPLTTSVDIRNAGFKLAPVDTNLFPAGFNNLNPDFIPLCVQALQASFGHYYPKVSRILLIPENHTRNRFYFESLSTLYNLLLTAGFEVRIGSLLPDLTTSEVIKLDSGQVLTLHPIQRHCDQIVCNDFIPDFILLNNDLSAEIPELLRGLKQPIHPSLQLGWSTRLKSNHFKHYDMVCREFAVLVGIDPWLINPVFKTCDAVDFVQRVGEEYLYEQAELALQNIQAKYLEYGIDLPPFLIIKADAGTYGMGVMTIRNAEELKNLNRKQRTKMSASKGGQKITKVIIQEGVYSFETWGKEKAVAEPVVYMLGEHVVGGFYRVHKERSSSESLNAPGMYFEPLAFEMSCNTPNQNLTCNAYPNRFYAYGVIARLALLAAAQELQEVNLNH
ncbi:MAG: glutamate--cysteine ligase [Gammaproteobacteria bacterium]|jgi:glutamate--cysteine ligase|nr:glutamate--cysteine ligase [Gammaproteobacteria bacterium]